MQAVTGTLSVFRWEIDDWTVAGEHVPVDLKAVGAKVDLLAASPDSSVSSVWTSGTNAGRFDVHYDWNDAYRIMRIDGQGRTLRDRSGEQVAAQGAIWDTITNIHTSLMLGDTGKWLIGISGLLLLSNIVLGLKLAWPKRGTWRKTLFGKPAGKSTAQLYGWHRKVGLWFAFPALFTVTAGVSMVFSDGLERGLHAELADPAVIPAAKLEGKVGFAQAVGMALETFPGSSFSGVSLPDGKAPGTASGFGTQAKCRGKWGTTVVWVAASDGRIIEATMPPRHVLAAPSSTRCTRCTPVKSDGSSDD